MRKIAVFSVLLLLLALLLPYRASAADLTVSLASDKASPQQPYVDPGDEITWTATAAGGATPYTYTFRSWTQASGIVVEQASASNTWVWTPSAGNYTIQVIVTDATGATVASDWVPYQIETGMTLEPFTADKLSPQPPYWQPGDEITWTANVSGGTAPYVYTFRTWSNTAGTVVGQTGTSNMWAWEPTVPDDYSVQVMVTDSLGQTVVSSWTPYSIVADQLQIVSLTPDKPSPQPPYQNPGDEITWTADVTGGNRGLTYTFTVWSNATGAVDVQTGSSNTFVWQPHTLGKYSVRVTVQDGVGQVVTSSWVDYMVDQPITIASFTSDKASPQPPYWQPGDEITWTASASGGTGQLTYRFRTWTAQSGMVNRQVSTLNTWAWEPTVPNDDYYVQVIVSDSVGQYIASDWVHYSIKATPLVLNSFTSDKSSPQLPYANPGDEITWTADVSGGNRGLTYKFRTYSNGVLTVQQSGASNTWVWEPAAGLYSVQVVVVDGVGQQVSSNWVSFRVSADLQLVSFISDKASPQPPYWSPGDEITWTATASGGGAGLTYTFRTYTVSGGAVTRQSGSSNTYSWKPSAPGDYSVQVIVSDGTGQKVASAWTPYSIKLTPLVLTAFSSDKAAPQPPYRNPGDEITWTASSTGGNGNITYTFRTWDGNTISIGQSGASNSWVWQPSAGDWSVQVVVSDSFGQKASSSWVSYLVADPLYFDSLIASKSSPQPAGTTITWTAAAHGGNNGYTYTFRSYSFATGIVNEQSGPSNTWNWTPLVSNDYTIEVIVKDGVGQTVSSDWVDYSITPTP